MMVRAGVWIAIALGCAPCSAQNVLPLWTVDKSASTLVWHDAKTAVLQYSDRLEVLDLLRGVTLWMLPLPKKPDQVGASAEFVAVRRTDKLEAFETKSGKPFFELEQVGAMAVLGGKLYCTRANGEIRQYAPPDTRSAMLKFEVPYQPFVDAKKGVHLGHSVVWRYQPEFLACFDFDTFGLAWKSAYGRYHYTRVKSKAGDVGKPVYEEVTVWDEVFGYYVSEHNLALHMSHMMVHGSKDSKEVKAEYLWSFDVRKGGSGSMQSLQRVDTDKPGAPLIRWTPGFPKAWLTARYEHASQPGRYRFDVYPGGGSIDLRSGYQDFEHLAAGAKGQVVVWNTPTTDKPTTFEVLGATSATKPLWKANGRVLPRVDEKEPYLVLVQDDDSKASRLLRLDPATGAELARLELDPGNWEQVPLDEHLLLRSPPGILVRVDRAALAITHRYAFASAVVSAVLLSPDEVLVRAGGKLARVSFKPQEPEK